MITFLADCEIINLMQMVDVPIHLVSTKCGQNPTSAESVAGLSASASTARLETMGSDGHLSQKVDRLHQRERRCIGVCFDTVSHTFFGEIRMLIAVSVVCAVGIAALFAFARRVDPRTGSLRIRRSRF
jgi:hypothetical protein